MVQNDERKEVNGPAARNLMEVYGVGGEVMKVVCYCCLSAGVLAGKQAGDSSAQDGEFW